ncbi:MAG TPA: hypothetical protein VGA56_05135 [Opitutaceae bacterium]
MHQLQLDLASVGRIELDAIVEEQMIRLMAEILRAVLAAEQEANDDRES